MSKIKGLRQKTGSNTYNPLVPFGTDGNLVDMISTLDLEQELKLGGGHVSSIDENGNNTVITETFTGDYTCVTTISEGANATTITSVLTGPGGTTKTKTITIPAEATNNVLIIGEVLS